MAPPLPPLARRLTPWLALVGVGLLAFVVVAPFLAPLAWAGVLGYVSWPIAERVRGWCNGRDTLAAALTTLLAALTLFVPLLWLVWLAHHELNSVYPALQAFVAQPPPIPDWLRSIPWLGDWLQAQRAHLLADPQGVAVEAKAWLTSHVGSVATLAGGVGRNLAKMMLVVVILFFFYRDGIRIVHEMRHVLSRFIGAQVHDYMYAVATTTRAVVYGILLTALVQGAVAGLGYWVAGLGSPVTLGIITALCALIPFATPLAWGAAGAWLLLHGETAAAIGVWVWGAAVVSQLDNVLRPLFISSVGAIPFLLVLFGVLGGLLAFGLIGLVLGPVVLAVAWAVWREWATHLESDAKAGDA